MFEMRGVDVVAMFDVSSDLIGRSIAGVTVLDMKRLEEYIREFKVDIAILTLPKEYAVEVSDTLVNTAIKGIWNFTGKELDMGESNIIVENEHIGDSLMTLCYEMARDGEEKNNL
jgi:redox-sensing transcriptional repressor